MCVLESIISECIALSRLPKTGKRHPSRRNQTAPASRLVGVSCRACGRTREVIFVEGSCHTEFLATSNAHLLLDAFISPLQFDKTLADIDHLALATPVYQNLCCTLSCNRYLDRPYLLKLMHRMDREEKRMASTADEAQQPRNKRFKSE